MAVDYRFFSDCHGRLPDKHGENEENEVCIIAGDVCEFGNKGTKLAELLKEACSRFKKCIFVPGNHEYYGTNIGSLESKLTVLMEDVDNFVLLQNGSSILIDDVKIIGATMWSDTSSIELDASIKMNDYRYIRYGPHSEPWRYRLKPYHTTGIHRNSVFKINKAIQEHDGECIVVSHHAPSMRSIDPRYYGDVLNPAYATEIKLDKWPTYWIHGHIHAAMNYYHYGCNVRAEPIGYYGEQTGFDPSTNCFTL